MCGNGCGSVDDEGKSLCGLDVDEVTLNGGWKGQRQGRGQILGAPCCVTQAVRCWTTAGPDCRT